MCRPDSGILKMFLPGQFLYERYNGRLENIGQAESYFLLLINNQVNLSRLRLDLHLLHSIFIIFGQFF